MTVFKSLVIATTVVMLSGVVLIWKINSPQLAVPSTPTSMPFDPAQVAVEEKSDAEKLQGTWQRHFHNDVTGAVVAAEDITFEGNSYRLKFHPMGTDGNTTMSFSPIETQLKPMKLQPAEKRIELIDFSNDAVKLPSPHPGNEWPTNLIERHLGSYAITGDKLVITFDGKIAYKKDPNGKAVANLEVILPLSPIQSKIQIVYQRVEKDILADKLSAMLRAGEVCQSLKQTIAVAGRLKEGDIVDIEVETKSKQGDRLKEIIAFKVEVMTTVRTLSKNQEEVAVFLRLNPQQAMTLKLHKGKNPLLIKPVVGGGL